jgi:hypothetical protein
MLVISMLKERLFNDCCMRALSMCLLCTKAVNDHLLYRQRNA